MTTTTLTPAHTAPLAGCKVIQGHYPSPDGTRVLIGQRVLGRVRLTDEPLHKGSRRYVVERELASHAELQAIVADYLQLAQRLGDCPMQRVLA